MRVFNLEELQKMDKNGLITIIGNYISDQEIWLNKVTGLEKEINKQKAEIERLTEELNDWKQRSDGHQFSADWHLRHNIELQKQVDELKEQRDVFKRLFESANTSNFSTNSIIETMNSFYREQAEHLAGLKIEQAVKNTAKEIYKKGKKLDKDFDMTSLGEYILANFLTDVNSVEVE